MYQMHALSKRVQLGLVIVAGCLLSACQTVRRPNFDEADLKYGPPPRSTLVERQDLPFRLAHRQQDGVVTTVLAYQSLAGKPSPVAVMVVSKSSDGTRISVQPLPASEARNEDFNVSVATLEYLYTIVLREDPEAQFCFADIGQQCNLGENGYSQAEVLLQIARARKNVVDTSAHKEASRPWHVITLTPENVHHADPDKVGARISGEDGSIEGATVFFNRAPHSTCEAKSRESGLANCRLIDQHGDDDSHSEQDKTPVLAIYPGDIRPNRVLLPTTLIQYPLP